MLFTIEEFREELGLGLLPLLAHGGAVLWFIDEVGLDFIQAGWLGCCGWGELSFTSLGVLLFIHGGWFPPVLVLDWAGWAGCPPAGLAQGGAVPPPAVTLLLIAALVLAAGGGLRVPEPVPGLVPGLGVLLAQGGCPPPEFAVLLLIQGAVPGSLEAVTLGLLALLGGVVVLLWFLLAQGGVLVLVGGIS